MLDAKIRETGWHAQVPGEATFDLVFSKEVPRDVRENAIIIGNRKYYDDAVAKQIGAKDVLFLVPVRDPEGPIRSVKDGVSHWLHHDSLALNDRDGAKRQGAMVTLQVAAV